MQRKKPLQRRQPPRREPATTLDALILEADKALRAWHIRHSSLAPACVTCGKEIFWHMGMDVGHFIKRSLFSTRWNTYNTAPQCAICNRVEDRSALIGKHLEEKWPGITSDLLAISRQPFRLDEQFIKDRINELNES